MCVFVKCNGVPKQDIVIYRIKFVLHFNVEHLRINLDGNMKAGGGGNTCPIFVINGRILMIKKGNVCINV